MQNFYAFGWGAWEPYKGWRGFFLHKISGAWPVSLPEANTFCGPRASLLTWKLPSSLAVFRSVITIYSNSLTGICTACVFAENRSYYQVFFKDSLVYVLLQFHWLLNVHLLSVYLDGILGTESNFISHWNQYQKEATLEAICTFRYKPLHDAVSLYLRSGILKQHSPGGSLLETLHAYNLLLCWKLNSLLDALQSFLYLYTRTFYLKSQVPLRF